MELCLQIEKVLRKVDYAKLSIIHLMQRKILCKVNFLKPEIIRAFIPFTLHNFQPTLIRTAK